MLTMNTINVKPDTVMLVNNRAVYNSREIQKLLLNRGKSSGSVNKHIDRPQKNRSKSFFLLEQVIFDIMN